MNEFTGLDEQRAALEAAGLRIYRNHMAREGNLCNWVAQRRTDIPSRECECNDGRPVCVTVTPHFYLFPGNEMRTFEVDVTGECDGEWYALKAYSIWADEIIEKLPAAERSLIAAWNALGGAA